MCDFQCQIWFRSGSDVAIAKTWFHKVQSIFSRFVRRDTLHLSETVSGFFEQYDYSIFIFMKYFLLN